MGDIKDGQLNEQILYLESLGPEESPRFLPTFETELKNLREEKKCYHCLRKQDLMGSLN